MRLGGACEVEEGWKVVSSVRVGALGFKVVVLNYRGGAGQWLE